MENKGMLENNPPPLAIASRVLSPETLAALRRPPYHLAAWRIADRWALEQPEDLRALEVQGEIFVLIRLLEQQQLEHEALLDASDALREGLSSAEVFQQHGIELRM
jgi:hypothetical protein